MGIRKQSFCGINSQKSFKVTVLLAYFLLLIWGGMRSSPVQAQTRKYFSHFNHMQSYFNPALTGYEGSVARALVRNQWSGFSGAPQTYFLGVEIDPMEAKGLENASLLGNTAAGLNLVHDTYGPFSETEALLSYGSRIRLTKSTNLRLGVAANYNTVRLDGNLLTTEQANDPTVNQFLNTYAEMRIMDFNMGMAFTHQNFYFAYGLQNVAAGKLRSRDIFLDEKPRVNVFQTGFKQQLSPVFTVLSHFMYRTQNNLPYNLDFSLKVMALEKFWFGLGHRANYANSMQVGFLMNGLRFGYAYEIPVSKSFLIQNPSHEFMVSYYLFRKGGINKEAGTLIW